jgi:hypothetical protein
MLMAAWVLDGGAVVRCGAELDNKRGCIEGGEVDGGTNESWV